jgi:hypothetical protein
MKKNKYFWERRIGEGSTSSVYILSRDHVAKVLTLRRLTTSEQQERLRREYERLKELYDAQISVPKPEGVFDIVTEGYVQRLFGYLERPGLVMERIHGVDASKVKGDSKEIVRDLYQQEMEKIRQLGFRPEGGLHNAIYDPKKGKIFIVDFDFCSKDCNGVSMEETNIDDIADYLIPENLRGRCIPETDILIPEEAIGLNADCPIDRNPESDDSWAEIAFYSKSGYHSGASFERPFYEFERIAKKHLNENK